MAEHGKGKKALKDFIAGSEGDPTSFFNQMRGNFNMPEPTPPTVNMPQMDSEERRFNMMVDLNGKQFENGERSQGEQEAEQRMIQNKTTGLLQKFVNMVTAPFSSALEKNLEQKINQNLVVKMA